MAAVRLLSREELEKRFRPYRCRFLADIGAGIELWETGWGFAFTLTPENGLYDEWDYTRVLSYVIGKTIPPGWSPPEE